MTQKGFILNQTVINEAQAILDTKDALALYKYMETVHKDRYSMLAYSVVGGESTIMGDASMEFLDRAAYAYNGVQNQSKNERIVKDMAQAYVTSMKNELEKHQRKGLGDEKAHYELDYKAALAMHNEVFTNNQLSERVWSMYAPLTHLPPEIARNIWEKGLVAAESRNPVDSVEVSLVTLIAMNQLGMQLKESHIRATSKKEEPLEQASILNDINQWDRLVYAGALGFADDVITVENVQYFGSAVIEYHTNAVLKGIELISDAVKGADHLDDKTRDEIKGEVETILKALEHINELGINKNLGASEKELENSAEVAKVKIENQQSPELALAKLQDDLVLKQTMIMELEKQIADLTALTAQVSDQQIEKAENLEKPDLKIDLLEVENKNILLTMTESGMSFNINGKDHDASYFNQHQVGITDTQSTYRNENNTLLAKYEYESDQFSIFHKNPYTVDKIAVISDFSEQNTINLVSFDAVKTQSLEKQKSLGKEC